MQENHIEVTVIKKPDTLAGIPAGASEDDGERDAI
jgi:hypothetical protein